MVCVCGECVLVCVCGECVIVCVIPEEVQHGKDSTILSLKHTLIYL